MNNAKSAEETKAYNIEVMGEKLGKIYTELWQEVAYLDRKWKLFVDLYGTKESRIDLLNQAAPHFFRIFKDILLKDILLHFSRLTDPPGSVGKKN